jgi:hypothetical protein
MMNDRRSTINSAVLKLRDRLKQIGERSRKIGEENTKRVLITPLLEALNWGVLDLDEVQNEYRAKSQDNPVDYAMFLNRSPCLFLEAKGLSLSLDDRKWVGQTIAYASMAGVDWCVLTNGDEYRFYNAHASVDAERKLFRSVTISDVAKHDFTVETLDLISKDRMQDKQIDTLWKFHFVDQRVYAVLDELFQGDDSFIRLIAKRQNSLTPGEIRQSLQRADVLITFPNLVAQEKVVKQHVATPSQKQKNTEPTMEKKSGAGGRVTLKAIIDAGLVAVPIEVEMTYKKQRHEATLEANGTITYQGNSYQTPSKASSAVRDGKASNGWDYWYFQDGGGELKLLDYLRKAFIDHRESLADDAST